MESSTKVIPKGLLQLVANDEMSCDLLYSSEEFPYNTKCLPSVLGIFRLLFKIDGQHLMKIYFTNVHPQNNFDLLVYNLIYKRHVYKQIYFHKKVS